MSKALPKRKKKQVSISEAAAILGVSIDTLRRWDKKGLIQCTRGKCNIRYFSVEELENMVFSRPMSISEAAEKLGISQTTLRRLEARGVISPERDANGVRWYTKESIEGFINEDYFVRKKQIEESTSLPVMEKISPQEIELVNELPAREAMMSSFLAKEEKNINKLLYFKDVLVGVGIFITSAVALIVTVMTILFLLFPEETATFLGYSQASPYAMHNQKIEKQIGNAYPQQAVLGESIKRESQQPLLGKLLKPFSTISLRMVKAIDNDTYKKIVPNEPVKNINEVLTLDAEGNIVPLVKIKVPNSSFITIDDNGKDKNFTEYVKETVIVTEQERKESTAIPPPAVISPPELDDGSITTVKLADGSITLEKLAPGLSFDIGDDLVLAKHIKDGVIGSSEIGDNTVGSSELAGTLAFGNGDFLDLSAVLHDGNGLQGLRLPNVSATPTSPSSGEGFLAYDTVGDQVLVYDGSSWASIGGGSGDITAVSAGNGLSGGGVTGAVSLVVLLTSSGTTGSTSSNSGLEVGSGGLTLLKGCSDNQILKYTDAGGWACASDDSSGGGSSGTNYLQLNNGALASGNQTVDFLLGGTSSSSAKFGFLNVNSGTPIASISAGTSAVSLSGLGVLGTSNAQPLALGNATTGHVIIDSGNGAIILSDATTINGAVTINSTLATTGTINGATISGGSLTATAVNGVTTGDIALTTGSYADPAWITSFAKSKVGLGNVENTALSTWSGTSTIVTTGTLTSGGTGTGFTLNFTNSTLSGNITGANISGVDISDDTNLSASDGITLSGDALTNTDKGSSQQIFKTIAVSGQSNVVTDTNADTLTLAAGSNITITTDASTDTVTIAAAGGGGGSYDAGTDLDLSGSTFSLETTLDSVDTINLAGTGTLNGLDAIDGTTESTLESAIDIAGDVTGTGLGSVTLASNVVDDSELVDSLSYTGTLTIANNALAVNSDAITSDGTTLTINAAGNVAVQDVLSVSGGFGSRAALIVDQLNSGDLIAASASGTTRFRVDSSGNVVAGGTINGATLSGGTLSGGSVSGGSLTATAVNGVTTGDIVLTSGSYADPAWITSLAKSKVGLGNVENTALSTWGGSSNIVTTGTLTSGGTGAGFTLSFANSTLSGNIGGSNIDESTLAGLTTSNFSSANISQWTNNSGFITDGNTNWDNSYGFITVSSSDSLTNKTIAAGSNTISGLTTSNFTSANVSQWTNDAGYITNGTATIGTAGSTSFVGSQLALGTSVIPAVLSAKGGVGSNAALIVDQLNSGDIIAASASGTTRFRIDGSGNLTASGTINGATISGGALSGGSVSGGTLTASAVNGVTTGDIVLTSGSYADPAWITSLAKSKVGLGSVENTALSTWAGTSNITTVGTLTGGATGAGFTLNFANSTLSGNIGGSNIDESTLSGIGNASLSNSSLTVTAGSGLTGGGSISLGGSGTVNIGAGNGITVNNDDVEVKLTTTGNTGSTSSNSGLEVGSGGLTLLKGCADNELLKYTDAGGWACASDNAAGGSGTNYLQINNGVLAAGNQTVDFVLGATSTSSAKFAVVNINSGTPTASISANSGANASFLTGAGVLGTTNAQTLTIGGSTTGNIILEAGSGLVSIGSSNTLGNGTWSISSSGVGTNLTASDLSCANCIGGTEIDESALFLTKAMVGLGSVENTALSTWAGTSNITTTGTLTSGGTGSGFTLSFTNSTLSGNITGTNIDESTLEGITASNMTAGDFSSVINSGTYGINISGTAADLSCTNCIGGTEIDESALSLTKSMVGLGNAENTALSTWVGTSNITTTGTLTSGSTGTGFTISLANSTISGYLPFTNGGSKWAIDTATNKTLTPVNNTLDFLIGGTATTSAKFAVLGVAGNTPSASVSAQNAAGTAVYLDSTGSIQSARMNTLTLGGSTTGNIVIDSGSNYLQLADNTIRLSGSAPIISAGTTDAAVQVNANGTGTLTLNSGATGNVQFFSSSNTVSSGGNLTLAGNMDINGSGTHDIAGTLNLSGTTGLTFSGAGGDITFTNLESIDNDSNGTITFGTNTAGGGVTLTAKDTDATSALTILSGGAAGLTLDAGGAATVALGNINANAITIGKSGTTTTVDGGLTVTAGQTVTLNSDAFTDFTGNGLTITSNALVVNLTSSGNTGSSSSNSGLEVGSAGLTLLKGCSDGQLLEYTDAGGWACADDDSAAGGSTNWTLTNGIIRPNNSTVDVIFGGTSTSSAKFAFMNLDPNSGLDPLASFSGNLRLGAKPNASTTQQTTWTKISQSTSGTIAASGTTLIASVSASAVYNGSLYVGTYKDNAAEVYRYDGSGSNWTKVSQSTAGTIASGGTASIASVSAMTVYDGRLYAGTSKLNAAELYRYEGGTTWTKISAPTAGTINPGGTANIDGVSSLAVYQGQLYVGTREDSVAGTGGAQLYRYNTGGSSWTLINTTAGQFVATNSINVRAVTAMVVKGLYLYIGVSKPGDADVLRYQGGTGASPFLSMNNTAATGSYVINGTAATAFNEVTAMAVFNGNLVVGMQKNNAAEVLMLSEGPVATSPDSWMRLNHAAGQMVTGGTSSIDGISALTVYNGMLFVGTYERDSAEIYRYTGGDQKFMKVSQAAGTIASGETANIDRVTVLQQTGGDLYAGTMELGAAEVYKHTSNIDKSYELQFNAKPQIAGGEQNSIQNLASIYYVASASANLGSAAGNTGSFVFSHGIQTRNGSYDVAEDYPTRDDSLEPGDVVAIDPDERGFVKKAEGRGGAVMGIYSEKPALRLTQQDAHIDGARAIPVALAGRVPVKVSTENGSIKAGDSLTASSIPGVAMKATKAGQVIGQAMGGFECAASADSFGEPKEGTEETEGDCIGKVLAYVATSYFIGEKSELSGNDMLVKLMTEKDSFGGETAESVITADRLVAGLELVTPRVIADEVVARNIKAQNIEGLEFLVSGILDNKVKNVIARNEAIPLNRADTDRIATPSATARNDVLSFLSVDGLATISGTMRVKENVLVEGILNIVDTLTTNNIIVSKLANFFGDVIFHGDVFFRGRPTVNNDTAGFAIIKKDVDNVEVVFEKEYKDIPVITANITLDDKAASVLSESKDSGEPRDKPEEKDDQDVLGDSILNEDVRYIITKRTTKGFTIKLNKKAPVEIHFSWTALAVEKVRTSESTTSTTSTTGTTGNAPITQHETLTSTTNKDYSLSEPEANRSGEGDL